MQDRIELLDIELLKDKAKLKEIDHWLKVFNWPNGWHYDLDIIWLLENIEKLKLPKGATIIDAGAGLGVTQFILAARGYNIISLDFTERQIPKFAKGIFDIQTVSNDLGGYKHEYMSFMTYGQTKKDGEAGAAKRKGSRLAKLFMRRPLYRNIPYIANIITNSLHKHMNLSYMLERMKDHSGFGKITFLRGTFNNIPLDENVADVLISVSAFEHNTFEDMPGSILQFNKVIKPGAPMLITTSAAEKDDWYFKAPKAWNFSGKTLSDWFGIPAGNISFDYRKTFDNIRNSTVLKGRISPFYKLNGDNALPYGDLDKAEYLPVGIIKIKK